MAVYKRSESWPARMFEGTILALDTQFLVARLTFRYSLMASARKLIGSKHLSFLFNELAVISVASLMDVKSDLSKRFITCEEGCSGFVCDEWVIFASFQIEIQLFDVPEGICVGM